MICTSEEFATAFHSVTQDKIGESRKQLFLLLKKTNSTSIDFNSIECRYPLEQKFMIQVLTYFGRWRDLVNLLSCENSVLIKKILSIDSCLQLISNFTNEELLFLFSGISYNAKLKIMNKLPLYLDSEKANSVFSTILEGYGYYLASKVLPACTTEFLLRSLKDVRWKPTTKQLMQIATKNPDVHTEILSYVKDKKVEDRHKVVLNHIAKHNPQRFLEIYQPKQPEKCFGRRITRKFLKTNTSAVIQNPNLYYQFFHKKQIVKSLGKEFPTVYLNMFPTNIDKFRLRCGEITEILQYLPAKKRNIHLLLDAFSRSYGKNFWDYAEYVTPQLLEMVPTEQREQVLKLEFKGNMSEDRWMCYYPTKKSIPYLKKRIAVSSDIKARADLIELLVETCKVNRDKAALTQLCHYMNSKHRNDHYSVRLAFLRGIQKSYGFLNLEESHWRPINDLIKLFSLNNEHFFYFDEFFEAHVRFLLIKKLPIKEQLREWVKARNCNFNILKDTPSYEKQCLIGFGEIIPEVLTSEDDLQTFSISFLNSLANWNKRHPKDPFFLHKFAKAMRFLKKGIENETTHSYSINCIMIYCLKGDFDEDLVSLYFAHSKSYADLEVILLVLEKEPRWFINNVTDVFKPMLYNYRMKNIFWRVCYKYHHVGIPQKLIEICLRKIGDVSEEDLQVYINCLSYLMSAGDFLEFLKTHHNERTKNITEEQSSKNLKIQKNLGDCLRHIKITSSILDVIVAFCEKISFKHFYSSLHSILYNVNEKRLCIILAELNKRSVLFRKVSLHLAYFGLSKPHVSTTLNDFIAKEKNASVRKCIFKTSFKLFTQNPATESFELFKSMSTVITESLDGKTFGLLTTTQKVTLSYFVPYALLCWDLLSNKASPKDKENYSNKFLKSLSLEQVSLLPTNFCTSIFESLFQSDLNSLQKAVQAFSCKLLVVTDEYLFLETIFYKLKCYISEGGLQKRRSCLTNFVTEFCSLFLENACKDKSVFTKFLSLWNGILKPHDAFDEYLHLHFTNIYLEELSVSELASKLVGLCRLLTNDYGLVFVNLYYDKLKYFVDYFFKVKQEDLEENIYVLIESLVSERCVVSSLLLALLLFTEHPPTFDSSKQKYGSILNSLEEHTDPVLQIYLHNHMINVTIAS